MRAVTVAYEIVDNAMGEIIIALTSQGTTFM